MSKLFSPISLRNVEIKNRIVMPPMCMYSSDNEGNANEWHFIHYATRAVGGAGLILLEATGVESCGRISDRDLGIWKDEHIEGLKKIVQLCKNNGAKVGIQLAHAGRKSTVLSEPSIAPSPIAFSNEYRVPEEMSKKDISRVIAAFKRAAKRSLEAGFDVIELHAAHGYLINEFLSPLTNKRRDEYGGSAENRVRFLREIILSVREVWPQDKPIIVRVSAEEYDKEGNNPLIISDMLETVKDLGIDMVNVSSGGVVDVPVEAYPGYQVRFAEIIKDRLNIPVIAGGIITNPLMTEEILRNDRADMIFIGRELLRNPYWPLNAAKELKAEIQWPLQYERSRR